MKEKLYKDREWLYEHYIVLQESTYAMAREAKCGQRAIWLWLRKFDIPTRTHGESALLLNARGFQPYRDEDWLREHYVVLQESTPVMAKIAGCSNMTIWTWLRIFDIPTRSVGEAIFLAERNYLDISPELLDVLNGELLGDGHIAMHGPRSARYSHGSKYRQYVVWLSQTFSNSGLEQSGKINRYDGVSPKGKPYTAYHYASRSYPELVEIRERWYPNGGKKIVPKDLRLNPIILRQFYLGDGGLRNHAGQRSGISFATHNFDKASIDYLLEKLRNEGFKVTYRPSENTIGMSAYSVKDFLDYMGPCPIACYQYKWRPQDNRKRLKKIR